MTAVRSLLVGAEHRWQTGGTAGDDESIDDVDRSAGINVSRTAEQFVRYITERTLCDVGPDVDHELCDDQRVDELSEHWK